MPSGKKPTPDGDARKNSKSFYLATRQSVLDRAANALEHGGHTSRGQAVAMLRPKGI